MSEERAGRIDKALEAYENVVKEDPQALEVFRDIAQLHLRLGHPEEALKAAERARDLAPKDPNSYLFLGNVRVAQGNLAKAAEAYEDVLKLDPKNLRALENLGNYYAILDPPKGIRYYERYLDSDPGDPAIIFQMGLIYQKSGDLTRARESYQKAAEYDPRQLAPHLALAELYESQKSTAAALAEYELAAQIEPRNPLLHMRIGHLSYVAKKFDEARSAFENVKALQPQEPSVYYWLARTSEEKKQWGTAAREAQKAYELSKDPQFLPLTAYYLTLDKRVPEAVKWLEKARKVDPDNANVLLFLGMDYLDLGKLAKAKDVLVHGVARHPKDPQLRFQLGVTEERMGKLEDAADQFKSVLALDPKHAAAMNYLGYTWAEHGKNLEEAEKLLRQAVTLDPENGAYLDSLGWVLFKRGKLPEARKHLEKASQKMPDVLILDHLGDVYWAEKNVDSALKTWNQALSIEPKNSAIKKKAAEAATHVLQGTDQRRFLKFMEGNFRQVADMRAVVSLKGSWKRQPIRTAAQVYYLRPDQLLVDLEGKEGTGTRLVLSGNAARVEPQEVAELWKGLPIEELAAIPKLLSGELMRPLDQPEVKTQAKDGKIHYSLGAQDAWIDIQRGLLTRLTQPSPNGGQDELEVQSYQMVDGLWMPEILRLRNRQRGLDARLHFSAWTLNEPENKLPFQRSVE